MFFTETLGFWLGVSCFLRWVHGAVIDDGCAGCGRLAVAIALVRDMRKQVDILNGQVTTQTEKAFDHSGR